MFSVFPFFEINFLEKKMKKYHPNILSTYVIFENEKKMKPKSLKIQNSLRLERIDKLKEELDLRL